MPGAGGPSTSLVQFINDLQADIFNMISALTARVTILESETKTAPSNAVSLVYSSNGSVTSMSNAAPVDIMNAAPFLGSSTVTSGTLNVGDILTVIVSGTASVGGSPSDLFVRLIVNGGVLHSCTINLPTFSSGAFNATFALTMRETTAFAYANVIHDTNIGSAAAEVAFSRAVGNSFSLIGAWSDGESGGNITSMASTIEIKRAPE